MVTPMISLGIIGLSPDNGHPYSYSAIINGYDESAMKAAGWQVILDYLKEKDESDFGIPNVKISHVWTQDPKESQKISKATGIGEICKSLEEMVNKVDGVIIARDDFENHCRFSRLFLESGKPVFIDKPLTVDIEELRFFQPYLENGQLMSCSGLHYAAELDGLRANIVNFGNIKLIRGAVINDWNKYGIHMLDAIFGVVPFSVESVLSIKSKHNSVLLKNNDGSIIQIDALNKSPKTFQLDFWSDKDRYHTELKDNFTAFRRTLKHFVKMMRSHKAQIPPKLTIDLMRILIAAKLSLKEEREISLDEIRI